MILLSAPIALFLARQAYADAKSELVGQGGVPVPLQRVVTVERPRGPIFIAIPAANVYGLSGKVSPSYCSPTVRATNSSNAPIEELVVGINFYTQAGAAGGSISRFANIKVGDQEAHYFYQLTVPDCRGIEGRVEIVRCKYSTGEDCLQDVQVLSYGTIPLRMKDR